MTLEEYGPLHAVRKTFEDYFIGVRDCRIPVFRHLKPWFILQIKELRKEIKDLEALRPHPQGDYTSEEERKDDELINKIGNIEIIIDWLMANVPITESDLEDKETIWHDVNGPGQHIFIDKEEDLK